MSKDIEATVNDITNVSSSEIDRTQIQKESFKNLLRFLNGYIAKSISQATLKDKVQTMLMEKLEAEQEDIPYGVLIKILEVTSKTEVDAATPLLKIIESASKQPENVLIPNNPQGDSSGEGKQKYTKEEYSQAKKLLSIIDDLQHSEFNDQEK